MSNGWNYEGIKREAQARRKAGLDCTIPDLLALSRQNDPFYMGTKGDIAKAAWFAELWERFGYERGVHLRRMHYQIVSQDPLVEKPDGELYENTEKDWGYLGTASKCARYLDFVNPGLFVDRRNPDAIINTQWADGVLNPCYEVEADGWAIGLPSVPALPGLAWSLPELPGFSLYGYSGRQQNYHLEVWVEKTTMNDALEPICRRFDVNLVTGAGEMSITAALNLVQRVKQARRPCRVFYISDFDPAGYGMPVSVARKLEFFLRDRGLDLDIRLEPIVLTREQVIEYQLPRQPIKDSERRKGRFEDVHGEGAVELDAMEALCPGKLAEIVKGAILGYYDTTLDSRVQHQVRRAWSDLRLEKQGVYEDFDGDLAEIKADYSELGAEFSETHQRFNDLVADFQSEIDAHEEKLEDIRRRWQAASDEIQERLEALDIDLPGIPEPSLPTETNGKLYDSGRGYLDQLVFYKAYQGGNGPICAYRESEV